MATFYQEQVVQNVMLHVKPVVELLQVAKIVFLVNISMVLHVYHVLEIVKYVQLLEYVQNAGEDSLLLPIIPAEVVQDHVQVALLMISQHAHHVLNICNCNKDHVFLVQANVRDAVMEFVQNVIEDIIPQPQEHLVYQIASFPAKHVLTINQLHAYHAINILLSMVLLAL